MSSRTKALLLDDGELDAVGLLLFEMGIDLEWKTGAEIQAPLTCPADILITNRKRALEVPHLLGDVGEKGPTFVCIHHKDFPSLREFLREVGAHILVHAGSDGPDLELLRELFRQLAHPGTERRQRLRLPCACRVQCLVGTERFDADLDDLSQDSCRIELAHELRVAMPISVYLPPEIDPASPTAYPGVVLRTQLLNRERRIHAAVVGFEEPEVQARIAAILAGQGLGTRIIQLALPPVRPGPEDPVEVRIDRRGLTRYRYGKRVACLRSFEDERPHVLMAHDLSMGGARVANHPDLEPGASVVLAIPQGKGVSPLLVEGVVRRNEDPQGAGIEFGPLDPDKREALRRLLSKLVPIDGGAQPELCHSDLTLLGEGMDPATSRKR